MTKSVQQVVAIANAMYEVANAHSKLDELKAQQKLNDTLFKEENLKQQQEAQAHDSD